MRGGTSDSAMAQGTSTRAGLFKVAIVGAACPGSSRRADLLEAGVEFEVFEKNDDVGKHLVREYLPQLARIDIPNTLYSYSFAHTGMAGASIRRRAYCWTISRAAPPASESQPNIRLAHRGRARRLR